MKKSFPMEHLDCAACAQKMEDAIRKIDGVEEVRVSFLTQKLTLTADESRMEEILRRAGKICRRIEPDCVIRS